MFCFHLPLHIFYLIFDFFMILFLFSNMLLNVHVFASFYHFIFLL